MGGGDLGKSAYLMNHGLFIWSFSLKGEKKTEKKYLILASRSQHSKVLDYEKNIGTVEKLIGTLNIADLL